MKKVSHCTELLALGVNEQTIQFLRTPPKAGIRERYLPVGIDGDLSLFSHLFQSLCRPGIILH